MKTLFKNTISALILSFHFGMFSQISEEQIYSQGADLMCESMWKMRGGATHMPLDMRPHKRCCHSVSAMKTKDAKQ